MWYPSVLSGVSVWSNNAFEASTHGGNADSAFSASILCQRNGSNVEIPTVDGSVKKVLSPKAYSKCHEPADYITFAPGIDFIAEGASDRQLPVADEYYESGFYDAMINANDGVHQITSAMYYSLIPHYEIEGK